MVPFVIGGKVGKVFYDGFSDIWNSGMKDDLLTLKNKYPSKNITFFILGHSLGGAMASIAAATLQNVDKHIEVLLNTYGQPRVGDKKFANAFDRLLFSPSRIIHNADIVPHLPPLNESMYYHHGGEIWYNNDMKCYDAYLCGDEENEGCSDSLNTSMYNMNDHKYYFGRDFIEYGINGCPDLGGSKRIHFKNT